MPLYFYILISFQKVFDSHSEFHSSVDLNEVNCFSMNECRTFSVCNYKHSQNITTIYEKSRACIKVVPENELKTKFIMLEGKYADATDKIKELQTQVTNLQRNILQK